jgi:hypothetical protein
MTDPEDASEPWDATWEGARRQLEESVRRATPEQRLAWLEEVLEIAWSAGALGPGARADRS